MRREKHDHSPGFRKVLPAKRAQTNSLDFALYVATDRHGAPPTVSVPVDCKEIRVVPVATLHRQAQRVKQAHPAQIESAPSPAKSEN
jgi:hypothetical protein